MGKSYYIDGGETGRDAVTVNPEAGMKKADSIRELKEGIHLFGAAIHGIR